MRRLRPIRVRLTLWYVLLLGLIMLGFSLALYAALAHSLYQQVDDELLLVVRQASSELSQESNQFTMSSIGNDGAVGALGERGLLLRLVSMDGRVIGQTGPYPALPIAASTLDQARQGQAGFATTTVISRGTPLRLYSVPYPATGKVVGIIQVGLSLQSAQDTLSQLLLILAFSVPLTLLIATLFGLFLANRALAPIDRITRAAAHIEAEHLSRRLDLDLPDDELGRLARTFDAMLARLDDAFQRQQQFTADASHELRTPLAIIKGEIDVTLMRPRIASDYQRTLREVGDEVDRLTRMVGDLLLLARADSRQPLVQRESLDLVDILSSVAEQVAPLAAAKGQRLHLDLATNLPLAGDADQLARLFLNLLDNAIKYTPEGGLISLRGLKADQGGAVVEVSDNGPGIAAEHHTHLFDRFYRTDRARARKDGGSGLGLAIASFIAQAHGGRIEIQSESPSGSCFRVWLPGA